MAPPAVQLLLSSLIKRKTAVTWKQKQKTRARQAVTLANLLHYSLSHVIIISDYYICDLLTLSNLTALAQDALPLSCTYSSTGYSLHGYTLSLPNSPLLHAYLINFDHDIELAVKTTCHSHFGQQVYVFTWSSFISFFYLIEARWDFGGEKRMPDTSIIRTITYMALVLRTAGLRTVVRVTSLHFIEVLAKMTESCFGPSAYQAKTSSLTMYIRLHML